MCYQLVVNLSMIVTNTQKINKIQKKNTQAQMKQMFKFPTIWYFLFSNTYMTCM